MRKVVNERKKKVIIAIAIVLVVFCIGVYLTHLFSKQNTQYSHYEETKLLEDNQNTYASGDVLQSEIYTIDSSYVSKIAPLTTLDDLKNNLHEANVVLYKKDGTTEVQANELVGTGMKLVCGGTEYKLAVLGDINGDGKVGITDITQMNLANVGLRASLVDEYLKAGDINGNGNITITDVTRVNLAVVDLIDIIAPNTFVPEAISTKDTITVSGNTVDTNSGIKEYWFELNNNGWVQNSDVTKNEYVFTNLQNETEYTVRMKVVDNAGNVKITKKVNISTLNIENANISIVASTDKWTNENVLVSVNYNSNVAKEKKQVSIDNGTTWLEYTGPLTIEKNTTIKARVTNSSGIVLEEQSKEITNIDKLAPKAFETTMSATTSSITVNAATIDQAKTAENGCSGIKEYEYKVINGRWKITENTTDTTYTFSDLEQGTEYYVVVTAIDYAGNKTENSNLSKTIKTGTVDDIGNIVITATPTEWTNEDVKVKISYLQEGYTKEYSLDYGRTWLEYTGEFAITENKIILARMKDAQNQVGTEVMHTVNNMDKLAPISFEANIITTQNSITVEAQTDDNEATSFYGKSGIKGYKFRINEGEWTDIITNGEYTFENLISGTEYTVEVIAIDNAGNEKEATNNGETIQIKNIDELIAQYGEIKIKPSTTEWTNNEVVVEVLYPSIEGFVGQISIDNGDTWQNYEGSVSVTKNTTVKARMKDSAEQTGGEKSLEIANIDKLAPNSFEITISTTQNSITLNAETTDQAKTEENGCSGIKEYRYVLDDDDDFKKEAKTEENSYTFLNLTSGKKYTIQVIAIDNAGNETEGTYVETDTEGPTITVTGNATEWTNQDVELSLEVTDSESEVASVTINGEEQTLREGKATYTVSQNGEYIIIATDTKGNTTIETVIVDKIDKTAPAITFSQESNSTELSTQEVEVTVTEEGSGKYVYKYLWAESAESPTDEASYIDGEFATGDTISKRGLAGDYYLHVYMKDNAGNESIVRTEGTFKFKYTISNEEELIQFAEDITTFNYFEGKTVYLIDDVVCTREDVTYNKSFKGTFEGENHTISNMTSTLFSVNYGTIKDFGIIDANITGIQNVSGIVGGNYGTIDNCWFGGTLTSTNPTAGYGAAGITISNMINDTSEGKISNCYILEGTKISTISSSNTWTCGIACVNKGTIEKSYNAADITGYYTSGIVGLNNGTINECYNKGDVQGSFSAAGISETYDAGTNTVGIITNCYNIGIIEGIYVGGIADIIAPGGQIKNCYNAGEIKLKDGGEYAGGIIRVAGGDDFIQYTYNIGNVSGVSSDTVSYLGGICGTLTSNAELYDSYSSGTISGVSSYKGGIIGKGYSNEGTARECYYKEGTANGAIGYYFLANNSEWMTNVDLLSDSTEVINLARMTNMPEIISIINGDNVFVADTTGINNGNPILAWQVQ